MQVTAFASAARTADPTVKVLATNRAQALVVVIDCTAVTATPSVVFTVSGIDSTSGKKYVLLASAAVTAAGTTVLQIGKGLPVTTNVSANAPVPDSVEVKAVHGDADSITYSVSVHILR